MSIQILGLRSWTPKDSNKEITYDAFHEKKWLAENVKNLFDNIDAFVEQIPKDQRYNIFYTINHCNEQKRGFKSCNTFAFDIDGGGSKGKIEHDRWHEYAKVVGKVTNIDPDKFAVVNSGNGLHLVFMKKGAPIKDPDFFKNNRHHYKAICDKINAGLKERGLGGQADTAIFDHRRILRLPNTVNRKPNKTDKTAALLQPCVHSISFDLKELSGLPDVKKEDQIPKEIMSKYPSIDEEAVEKGCSFLCWAKNNPNEVSEPQWYQVLSIIGRFKDGSRLAHTYSENHQNYSRSETDAKLEQAILASGPRTCKSIQEAGYNDCGECPHKDSVVSPISIVSDGHIKTEHTGFHTYIPGKGLRPNYEDMRKAFEKKTQYKGLNGSKAVMTFTGTHYTECSHNQLEEFAQDNFNPKAKTMMTKEFMNLVIRTNLRHENFWRKSINKKINFQNGHLDLLTETFSPHSPDIGFRYALPYDYQADAKAPNFQHMLEKVTCGDADLQKVLLEFMGYSLSSDDCWAQKALVLVGSGSNGKSTFLNVIRRVGGSKNYSSANIKDLQKSEYLRQTLDGKLFNISEETPTSAMMDTSLFKDLVTGGEVSVRTIYRDPYYMKNTAKLIFSCNELPEATDTTLGYYRRQEIVPFNARFSRSDSDYDPHVDKKLEKELSGIFNLALWGYKRLVENGGFTRAKKITETIDIYKKETDTVLNWFLENTDTKASDEKYSAISDLYFNYRILTDSQGQKPVSRSKFTRDLRRHIKDFDTRYKVKQLPDKSVKRVLVGVIFGEGVGL